MRNIRAISAIVLSALPVVPALAHPGHVADNGAGHDHVAALLALMLAVGVAGVVALRAIVRSRGVRRRAAERRRPVA